MAGSAKKRSSDKTGKAKNYTYADYLTWKDGRRYEIIDGEVIDMTPAPSFEHQEICGALYSEFRSFLRGQKCRAVIAPFDVVFSRKNESFKELKTVLQPDISIICDPEKIEKNAAFGAPDLVVEVVSPSTASHDNVKKRNTYEQAGVREYWLVYPEERYVRVYQLDTKGKFGKENTYDETARIQVGIFPDLTIDMTEIFPPAPKIEPAGPEI